MERIQEYFKLLKLPPPDTSSSSKSTETNLYTVLSLYNKEKCNKVCHSPSSKYPIDIQRLLANHNQKTSNRV